MRDLTTCVSESWKEGGATRWYPYCILSRVDEFNAGHVECFRVEGLEVSLKLEIWWSCQRLACWLVGLNLGLTVTCLFYLLTPRAARKGKELERGSCWVCRRSTTHYVWGSRPGRKTLCIYRLVRIQSYSPGLWQESLRVCICVYAYR